MLPHTLRAPVVPLGWPVWGLARGKHTPLPYELEAICSRCGSWGLDLCCASLPASRKRTGRSICLSAGSCLLPVLVQE